jgi:hypothetical protein
MYKKTQLTMARDAARELLRIHHPELNVKSMTRNAVLIAHARQILGDQVRSTDPDVIVKQLIDHLRAKNPATTGTYRQRIYKHDKAMLAAIERIGDHLRTISILSRAQNGEKF